MLVSDHMTCILPPDWTRLMNEVNSVLNFVLLQLKYLVFSVFSPQKVRKKCVGQQRWRWSFFGAGVKGVN